MRKFKLAYISDQKFFKDDKNEWYTSASFPLDIYFNIFDIVSEWTCFGRLYQYESDLNYYKIPNVTFKKVTYVGIWNQIQGPLGYIKNILSYIKLLRKVVKKNDIIWLKLSYVSSYFTYLFCNLNGKIIITQLVGDVDVGKRIYKGNLNRIMFYFMKKLIKLIHKRSDIQVFVSKYLADKYAYKKGHIIIANENRITEDIIVKIDQIKMRDENTPFKILFIGRLSPEKGIFDLLKAVQKIRDENLILTIIGDGILKDKIIDYVNINNLTDKVNIKGYAKWGKQLFDIIKSNHVLILPSYSEGLGLVILEAMSMGVPVIASNVGGIPEIVYNNYNGLLFEPGNIDELVNKIKYLINNEKIRYNLSINSVNLAKENTIEKQMNKILEELKAIIN
ncbi:glycosyltransferase family 4 protein [Thermoanaerobacterium thermosaccharolyticum]|uniref:glycosyltransferase family 4 protein n=1 Tax=Thermoanaerobacterium thermosaccharolyticum TaxID=1517 RepID=UPI003DA8B2D4